MFRKYKATNASRLSQFTTNLCKEAKTCFPQENHSNDRTGRLGEDIPLWMLLWWDYNDWRKLAPSANTQQQANRIVNAWRVGVHLDQLVLHFVLRLGMRMKGIVQIDLPPPLLYKIMHLLLDWLRMLMCGVMRVVLWLVVSEMQLAG